MIGHIADDPQVMSENGTRYLAFHLAEVAGTEFHLRLFPTTPKRHRGDLVEVSYAPGAGNAATVDTLFAVPDAEALQKRNREYLANIKTEAAGRQTGGRSD
jgi:hypothetical protein